MAACLWPYGAEDAEEERADGYATATDGELGLQAMHAPAGLPEENAMHDGLLLCRVLAHDEHPRRAVQTAAVNNLSPLDAELARAVRVALGALGAQPQERLANGAGTTGVEHGCLPQVGSHLGLPPRTGKPMLCIYRFGKRIEFG